MNTLDIKSGFILLFVLILIQLLVRLLFRPIEFHFRKVNKSEDWLRLIRDTTAILAVIVYVSASHHLDSADFTVDSSLFFFILVGFGLLSIENIFLHPYTSSDGEMLDRLKRYPFSQFTHILLFAPIIEEIVCRKIILGDMNLGNMWIDLAVSTFLFAILHLQTKVWDFILLVSYGLILGMCYVKTESIINPIILHLFINALQLLILIHRQRTAIH